MATLILTWNPEGPGLDEAEYDDMVESTASGRTVVSDWGVGVRRGGIGWGDRAFLLRQRRDRGIVASGKFTSGVFQGPHWNGSGREANYGTLQWDHWLSVADRLPVEELKRHIPGISWDHFQGSGARLRDDAVRAVEALWEVHLQRLGRRAGPAAV